MLAVLAPELIRKFVKFCVVGGSGMVIDFAVTYLFKEIVRTNKYVANSLGFICAATSNYVLNRVWTFESTDPGIARQYLVFVAISVAGLLINNAIVWLCNDRFRINFYLSKLIAIGVVTFWNFVMNYAFNF